MASQSPRQLLAVVVIALILSLSVWMVWDSLNYKRYSVEVSGSFSGLQSNAPVQFNGVVVGKVTDLQFDPDDPRKIHLVLKVDKLTPLSSNINAHVDSKAHVVLSSDTQDKNVSIQMDTQDFLPMANVAAATTTNVGTMSKLSSNPNDLKAQAIVNISKSLQKTNRLFETLITEDNAESIKQILYSLQQVSGVLSANTEKLNTLVVNASSASKDFSPLLSETKKTLAVLKSQTLPETNQLLINLNDMTNMLRDFIQQLKENPSVIIRGSAKPELGPGESLRYPN